MSIKGVLWDGSATASDLMHQAAANRAEDDGCSNVAQMLSTTDVPAFDEALEEDDVDAALATGLTAEWAAALPSDKRTTASVPRLFKRVPMVVRAQTRM